MAEGVRRATGSDVGLGITGVAGPDEQEGVAPGSMFVGLALPGGATVTQRGPGPRGSGAGAPIRGDLGARPAAPGPHRARIHRGPAQGRFSQGDHSQGHTLGVTRSASLRAMEVAMVRADNGPRVLVVDDEPSIVDAVATSLRYEGFTVDEATTGSAVRWPRPRTIRPTSSSSM